MTTIRHNIADDLNSVLVDYRRLSGKSDEETLSKQGGKLGFEIRQRLRALAPNKGAIREQLLGRLRDGKGIQIRDSVRESVTEKFGGRFKKAQAKSEDQFWGESPGRLNWKYRLQQEMVRREIAVRESGRGVLGVSILYPKVLPGDMTAVSRYGQLFSKFGIHIDPHSKYAIFLWPGISHQSAEVVKGLNKPRAETAIEEAMTAVRDDIAIYVADKQQKLAANAVKAMVKH